MKYLIHLLLSLLLLPSAIAGLFDSKPSFLTAEEAFAFSSTTEKDRLLLKWDIAEGYYLYKKEINIQGKQVAFDKIIFPKAERHQDEIFGEVEIYRNQLNLAVPFALPLPDNSLLEVSYQGCTKGFCYPPQTVTIPLNHSTFIEQQTVAPSPPDVNQTISEQIELAQQLSHNQFSVFWFLILGLGLAFTPCILPMLPLLSAIVIGQNQRPNTAKALLLSLSYIQGMALTYTLLGLTVSAIGLPFQIALQSPPVLISLSLLFIILALAMFGLFTLQLPNSWQQKLHQYSQKQQGGSVVSVFIMGMIAGLVASPCTSAPLSGALLYVAQSGDLFTGAIALYLLGLGMGIPLVLITLFGNRILPKSGEWLLKVKTIFGFVMLALPIFLLSRVLPTYIAPLLWSALAVAFLIWCLEQLSGNTLIKKAVRIFIIFAIILASKPWSEHLSLTGLSTTINQQNEKTLFVDIHNLDELKQQLAQHSGKFAMLDLYADWCVACKEFDQYTFSDPTVKEALKNMVVLRIDMTKNSPENTALMKEFHILGLPTILFFTPQGQELNQQRITGFMAANDFANWLNNLHFK